MHPNSHNTTKTTHVNKDNNQDLSKQHDIDFTDKLERSILHVAGLAGVYYRGNWDKSDRHFSHIHTEHFERLNDTNDHKLIAPPKELKHWYSIDSDENYLQFGKKQAQGFRDVYEQSFGVLGQRDGIIEIGCSAGRLIRWFEPEATRQAIVWGADIDASAITWAQQNLPKSLNFFTNTTSPHLPFADESFNLVFGGSLFTHIGELADAWFLEIRRLLRKERSMAIITLNDENTIEWHHQHYPDFDKIPNQSTRRRIDMIKNMKADGIRFGKLITNSSPWQQSVWYSSDFIVSKLKKLFEVKRIPGFYGYQTGYVLTPA